MLKHIVHAVLISDPTLLTMLTLTASSPGADGTRIYVCVHVCVCICVCVSIVRKQLTHGSSALDRLNFLTINLL